MATITPLNLKMTCLDITSVYGKPTVPPLAEVPHHTMNFADYGMKYLNSADLASQLKTM